jgi:hypothetical protein
VRRASSASSAQTRDERAQGEPLEGVAVVLVHVDGDLRPTALQAVVDPVAELQHRQRPQHQTRLAGERVEIEILPDAPALDRAKVVQPSGRRGDAAIDLDVAGRRRHRRQPGAIERVARRPAPLHEHRGAVGELQRRHEIEPRAPLHLPVVEPHAVGVAPLADEADAPMVLRGGLVDAARQRLGGERRLRAARVDGLLQRDLLLRAVELPHAQPRGQRRRDDGGGEHDPAATALVRPCHRRQSGAMKIVIVLALVGIIAALGSAGVFMLRRRDPDAPATTHMARALAVRVGLSVALFAFILFSYWMGWIQPTGIPAGR